MAYGTCYCPAPCPRHEREIDAAEDMRDNPPNDCRDDWIDNQFERAMYPRQWDS